MNRILPIILWALVVTTAPAQPPTEWVRSGAGETVLLYQDYEALTGYPLQPMSQGAAPSCVGTAAAKALEIRHGLAFDAAYLYGISRVAGNMGPNGKGSHARCVAAACETYGALPALDYTLLGIDLAEYNHARANEYGPRGPPQALITVAGFYKTSGSVKVRTTSELRRAIANGYPVVFGSSVGFGPRTGHVRDEGFLRSRFFSRWSHAMVFIGCHDGAGRRGFLILNSWGTHWIRGPQKFGDEPGGSFWVSYSDAAKILSYGDAFVLLDIPSLK